MLPVVVAALGASGATAVNAVLPGQLTDVLANEAGDVASDFEQFLREQREALMQFLRRRLPTEEDAQDAVQESFARLVRYRDIEPPTSWRPLLYRIAVNVALDQQRLAKTHHTGQHVSYDQVLYAVPSDNVSPDECLAQQQLVARMWQIVQTLPPRCRDIYVLSRARDMSQPQIAALYGISVKAVEKQITRALATLRRELGDAPPATSWPHKHGEKDLP